MFLKLKVEFSLLEQHFRTQKYSIYSDMKQKIELEQAIFWMFDCLND